MPKVRRVLTTVPSLAALITGVALAAPAAAAQPQPLQCGSVITHNTILANDIGPCSGNGLVIAASNITLDLNGHSVAGTFTAESPLPPTNTSDTVGISFRDTTGSTLMNGSVYHFAAGLQLHGGSGNHITKVNVHDNIGALPTDTADNGDGIDLFGSNNNLIDNNVIVHNGVWSGISLLSPGGTGTNGSSYNRILDNTLRDNNVAMLNSSGGPDWKRDVGIAVEGPGATHNLIANNTITGSGTNGIEVFPACSDGYAVNKGCNGTVPNDYNTIRNNTVTQNGYGLPLSAPLGDGIQVLTMGPSMVVKPGHETIDHNAVDNNERNGISLGTGNGVGNNGSSVYGCSSMAGAGGGGLSIPPTAPCGVNFNTVEHNIASNNGVDGIYVSKASDHNTIAHNVVTHNGVDGIGLAALAADNVMSFNVGAGNARWDGSDMNPGCGTDTWSHDALAKVNQPCVR